MVESSLKRSSSCPSLIEPPTKRKWHSPSSLIERRPLRSELVALAGGSKTSIARVLQKLQLSGMLLDDDLGSYNERKKLTQAAHAHADFDTPYGRVVQQMPLQRNDGTYYHWEFVHPLAFIWYLSLKCVQFGDMMEAALSRCGNELSLLLYGDDITPGNVLRHDEGRKVFAFYYAFLEWPDWILHKSDAWLFFGALRTSIIADLRGGTSAVFSQIIKVMFAKIPFNFRTGIFYNFKGAEVIYRSSFKGIIADEKGLKEAFSIKGASGLKVCPSCQNIFNFDHKEEDVVVGRSIYRLGVDSIDRRAWIPHSNESIFVCHNRLSTMVEEGLYRRKGEFKKLQIETGVNYNPFGLLGDPSLRTVIKPVDHYIRDWQHTYCSNGVASSHLAAALHAICKCPILKRAEINLDTVTEYCSHFVVPRAHGKINKYWFDVKYLANDKVRHFASDVLHMVPCLLAFMVDVIKPKKVLLKHIEALDALNKVLSGFLHAGPVTAEKRDELQGLVDRHRSLFRMLYGIDFVKIKFHHAGHIPQDLWKIGHALSCFPLERKHRSIKSKIVYVFRNVEMTTTKDFVNHVIQQFSENRFQFKEYWLENPKPLVFDNRLASVDDRPVSVEDCLHVSLHAHTPVGEMHRDDVVLVLHEDEVIVGAVDKFFQGDGEIIVQLTSYEVVRHGVWTHWDTTAPQRLFLPLRLIRANLKWARRNGSTICVILPPAIKLDEC